MSIHPSYLKPPFRESGFEYKSPYMAALIDARHATGRDILTGEIVEPNNTGSWAGALTYMALIDHIGNHISKTHNVSVENTSFIRALKDFTSLVDEKIYALYALRCCFTHDYSLINVGKGKMALLLHHQFQVHRGESLIQFPITPWNGIRTPATNNLITTVSLKKVGDLVEEIHSKLLLLQEKDEIKAVRELLFIQYSV